MKTIRTVLALLLLAPLAGADDWPRWRGPQGDGICREQGLFETWPKELKPLWRAEVGKGYAGPVAQNGRIYLFSLVDGKDTLTCFDADDGKILWNFDYPSGWTGGYSGTRCPPNIQGDRIYTLGGAGDLTARKLDTGEELWRTNVLNEAGAKPITWGQASNPLIVGDRIFVQGGISGPVALAIDKNTGRTVWKSEAEGGGSYAAPVMVEVEGQKQLLIFATPGLFAINPDFGKTIWHLPWTTEYDINASDPIFHDGYLFISSAYNHGAAMLRLSKDGFEKVWEDKVVMARFQPAILDGGHLYVNSEGTLKCLKWPTSEVVWTTEGEKNLLGFGGSIVRIPDGRMILLSQTGRLTLARATPQKFEPIGSTPDLVDGSEIWATPAIHNGRLYIKGAEELICLKIQK